MSRRIDPIKLKAAAEHLEWAIRQHSVTEETKGLLAGIVSLLEAAKAGEVLEPIDRMTVPYAKSFCFCEYDHFREPDLESAYYEFAAELRGGRSEQELRLRERTAAMIAEARGSHV